MLNWGCRVDALTSLALKRVCRNPLVVEGIRSYHR